MAAVATVSPSYSSGVQSVATKAAQLARRVTSSTPIEDTRAINEDLRILRDACDALMAAGARDLAAHEQARRIVERADTRFAQVTDRAAAERAAAISRAGAVVGA